MYVPIRNSHRNVEFCHDKIIAPRDYNNAKLAISKM